MKLTAMTSHAVVGGAEEIVYIGTRAIVVVYAALALIQLLLVEGPAKWVLASVSGLSVVAGLLSAQRLPSASPSMLQSMVWLVCAVPLVNGLMFIAATGAIAPTMVMLSIVGIGAVAPTLRPGLVLTLVALAAWGAIALAWGPHPEGLVLKHAIDLILASALAFAIFCIRALTWERLRLAEERLTERVRELDEARRQLELASTTDQLTGCFNRRGWDERVVALHRLASREGANLSLGIIDLDRFKQFNDRFGHHAGDQLLSSFAREASSVLRDVDVLARWGGDEFTVALYGCAADEEAAIFQRIAEAVAGTSTCSIGFARVHAGESTEGALSRADHALYRAKRGGRNQVARCSCEPGTAVCHEEGQLSTLA